VLILVLVVEIFKLITHHQVESHHQDRVESKCNLNSIHSLQINHNTWVPLNKFPIIHSSQDQHIKVSFNTHFTNQDRVRNQKDQSLL
jgi:hypothetical protein